MGVARYPHGRTCAAEAAVLRGLCLRSLQGSFSVEFQTFARAKLTPKYFRRFEFVPGVKKYRKILWKVVEILARSSTCMTCVPTCTIRPDWWSYVRVRFRFEYVSLLFVRRCALSKLLCFAWFVSAFLDLRANLALSYGIVGLSLEMQIMLLHNSLLMLCEMSFVLNQFEAV